MAVDTTENGDHTAFTNLKSGETNKKWRIPLCRMIRRRLLHGTQSLCGDQQQMETTKYKDYYVFTILVETTYSFGYGVETTMSMEESDNQILYTFSRRVTNILGHGKKPIYLDLGEEPIRSDIGVNRVYDQ